ncbi:hypothetical protein HWV62_15319 [Athelia sp. TMB]|nr:hypothetical protein HWV62_15319 [Athelia sp. TMB]
MVHGWPSLWSTWSNQILEFQDKYHIVAPDLRGFGASTHPGDVQSSGTMGDLVGDLVCILEHAEVKSAVCVGHDWGAQVCHSAARMRPDIFTAVAGLVLPYIPSAGPFIPIAKLVPMFPKLAYNLYFEANTSVAIAELDQNIRRSVRGVLRTVDSPPPVAFLKSNESFLEAWSEVDPASAITGDYMRLINKDFRSHLYRSSPLKRKIISWNNTPFRVSKTNKYISWEFGHSQQNNTIPQPALSILPLNDPVADWVGAARVLHTADYFANLKTVTVAGAHWMHLENAVEVNKALREWLDEYDSQIKGGVTRPVDEL